MPDRYGNLTRDEAAASRPDPRPCAGGNANVCVAEGCYGESCRANPTAQADRMSPLASEQVAEMAGVLAEAFDEWLHRMHGVVSSCRHEAEASGMADALAPVVARWIGEARGEALRPIRDLFAGGPDTPCRTTWLKATDYPFSSPTECVVVPIDDLRAALGGDE